MRAHFEDVFKSKMWNIPAAIMTFEYAAYNYDAKNVTTPWKQNFRPSFVHSEKCNSMFLPIRIIIPVCPVLRIEVIKDVGLCNVFMESSKIREVIDASKNI